MTGDETWEHAVRIAIEQQADFSRKSIVLSTQRNALLAAHLSNSLRSIALALRQVADGKNPAAYIQEIVEQSDKLWALGTEWTSQDGE